MKQTLDISYYQNQWDKWNDMKTYGPMSRHVRSIILQILKPLKFKSVLDVGCGVGTLLNDLQQTYPNTKLSGTELFDDSLKIARQRLPQAKFQRLDLVKDKLKHKSDLVLCIDVLEHIPADTLAMKHLAEMTNKYVLVVVPLGPLFEIEKERVGHVHGYSKKEFDTKLRTVGLTITKSIQWGFPFYNLYRRLLHHLPESSTTGKYTWKKKLTSEIIFRLLSLSIPSPWGERYFVLCEKK